MRNKLIRHLSESICASVAITLALTSGYTPTAQAVETIQVGTTSFNTTVYTPTAVVTFQLPAKASYVEICKEDKGICGEYASAYINATSGTIDIFRSESRVLPGVYQFRVRIKDTTQVSEIITALQLCGGGRRGHAGFR